MMLLIVCPEDRRLLRVGTKKEGMLDVRIRVVVVAVLYQPQMISPCHQTSDVLGLNHVICVTACNFHCKCLDFNAESRKTISHSRSSSAQILRHPLRSCFSMIGFG